MCTAPMSFISVVQFSDLTSIPLFVSRKLSLSRTSHSAVFLMCRRSVRAATAFRPTPGKSSRVFMSEGTSPA